MNVTDATTGKVYNECADPDCFASPTSIRRIPGTNIRVAACTKHSNELYRVIRDIDNA